MRNAHRPDDLVPILLAALETCAFRLAVLVAALGEFHDVDANALDQAVAAIAKAKGMREDGAERRSSMDDDVKDSHVADTQYDRPLATASENEAVPSIEQMRVELLAAGWCRGSRDTEWWAPGGALYRGPAAAWQHMKAHQA